MSVQPGEKKARGDLGAGYNYVFGAHREMRARLYLEVHGDRMRGKGQRCGMRSSA